MIPSCYIEKETDKFDQLDETSDSSSSSDEDEENLSESVSSDCCCFSSDENSVGEETFVTKTQSTRLIARPPQVYETSNVIQTFPGLPIQMRHKGFRLVGDNIDKTIHRRHLRLNTKNQSVHYFHVYAVENRIDVSSFSDDCTDISHVTDIESASMSFLPKSIDDVALKDNIGVLISRTLYKYLDFFKFSFDGIIQWHIHHKYYKEMSNKSEVVSSGTKPCLAICLSFHF